MNARNIVLLAVVAAAAIAGYALLRSEPAAFGSLKDYAVVQSLDSPDLTLVNLDDNELAETVTLPVQPDQIVLSAVLDRIIYTSRAGRSVSVYDIGAQADEAVISLPFAPDTIVLAPDGLTVAAAGAEAGSVALIALDDRVLLGTIADISDPLDMTFSDSSEFLFVSDSAAGELAVINAATARRIDPVPLSLGGVESPAELSAMTRTPNGLYGLVVDSLAGRMSVINFRNWQEVASLRLGSTPSRPYGTADGQYMLIANTGDSTVSVLSTEFFEVAATLPGVSSVTGISTGYFETLAFVVSDNEDRAVLIDLEGMELAGEVALPGTPGVPVTDAEGRKIYVTLRDRNELVVFDTASREVVSTVKDVGNRPWKVALAQTNNYCH